MENYDISIIGGGVAGLSALAGLIEARKANPRLQNDPIKIVLIDDHKKAGPGIPYEIDQDKTLLLNDSIYGAGIGKGSDTIEWLYNHPERAAAYQLKVEILQKNGEVIFKDKEKKIPELVFKDEKDPENDRHIPRALYGEYCVDKFIQLCQEAEKVNIQVTAMTATQARALDHEGLNHWCISIKKESQKEKIICQQVILAVGHLPSDKFDHKAWRHHSQFINTPLQADLTKINSDAAVIVAGTYLTAVDIVKKLKNRGHTGDVYLLSRRGEFSSIKNLLPKEPSVYSLKYLTPDKLNKQISMDELITLFNMELANCFKSKKESAFTLHDYLGEKRDAFTLLQEQMAAVRGREISWEISLMLDEIYFNILRPLGEKCNDTVLKIFLEKYFSPYLQYSAGMPLISAKFMLNQHLQNKLHVIYGNANDVELKNGMFTLKTTAGIIHAPYLLNATGPGLNINNNYLLADMKAKGFIAQNSFGGIQVDAETNAVYSKSHGIQPGLYCMGACAGFLDVYALYTCWLDGIKIGKQVMPSLAKASVIIANGLSSAIINRSSIFAAKCESTTDKISEDFTRVLLSSRT